MSIHWLHLSDIHFHNKDAWRDERGRGELLAYLAEMFDSGEIARPDLIFCTGDIAFGETKAESLSLQYDSAKEFLTCLLSVCGGQENPLPITRLFVVPGNHDINRSDVDEDAQAALVELARNSRNNVGRINSRLETKPTPFLNAMKRLAAYENFVKDFLPHQYDREGRCHFAQVLDINGIRIGIAGFNSAWSCAGPEDDRHLWLGAEWQFNRAARTLADTELRIGLIHHPTDWLNEAEREVATRRISKDFDFWLHGHAHNAWVEPLESHVRIGAGAVSAGTAEEIGINLVKLDSSAARNASQIKSEVHLHQFRDGWTMQPVSGHAPRGIWPFNMPKRVRAALEAKTSSAGQTAAFPSAPSSTPAAGPETSATLDKPSTLEARPQHTKLFGRDALIKQCADSLQQKSILLLYGMRGNGKSALLDALDALPPLGGKTRLRLQAMADTSADDIFRTLAWILGEQAEYPQAPSGDAKSIAAELKRRYPQPTKPVYLHLDWAHLLLTNEGWRDPSVRQLLLGLQLAYAEHLPIVLELRERPSGTLLGQAANQIEVPGLDKASMGEMLAANAPQGANWCYKGDELKRLYGWIGAGNGKTAHPLTLSLLVEVARGYQQSPKEVLERHSVALEEKIEEKLLRDLFNNVLNSNEQVMIETLALYRTHIPHDHGAWLQSKLKLDTAWDGLYRRCLLASDPRGYEFYLHSFIATWLRKRQGYAEQEDVGLNEVTFILESNPLQQAVVRNRHVAIAECWLQQLGHGNHRTQLNIDRALEAFYHLLAGGSGEKIHDVAVDFLSGKLDWALKKIQGFYIHLRNTDAPVLQQAKALEYWLALDPQEARAWRFLGECYTKLEGWESDKALHCFEQACSIFPGYPHQWANLGRAMREHGPECAREFLRRLEQVEREFPQVINDYVISVRSDCQKVAGDAEAARQSRKDAIASGRHNVTLYSAEAKALLEERNFEAGLEVLQQARRAGCVDDVLCAIEADLLQAVGRTDEAQAMRIAQIEAGSTDRVLFNNAANCMFDEGDEQGALRLVELAIKLGIADQVTERTYRKIKRKIER